MIEIVSTRTNAGVQLIGECSVFVSGTMFDNTPATRSLRSGVTKINRDARNPFASSLASPVLSDVRQAALEFRTEIGGFGRDLDGHASGFTPIEPRNENRPVVILGSMFSDAGYAGEIFPLPRHRRVCPNSVPLAPNQRDHSGVERGSASGFGIGTSSTISRICGYCGSSLNRTLYPCCRCSSPARSVEANA